MLGFWLSFAGIWLFVGLVVSLGLGQLIKWCKGDEG
jgi:hypothetical protein